MWGRVLPSLVCSDLSVLHAMPVCESSLDTVASGCPVATSQALPWTVCNVPPSSWVSVTKFIGCSVFC